ncbi:unnamed protein product [Rotaria sp. Silwood2]|nr:unnamed protein product [Rotaria sp. Silwood2]
MKISRIRDNKRRQNLNSDLLQQKKVERINNKQSSSYKSRQSFVKAVKRVLQSLPKETLREAHQLFLSEHDHTDAYLSLGSFSDFRP